jgi:glycosyltransferase involved in cell wall biosynthesis
VTTDAVTVVVPTRDRPGQLAACLAALDAQQARPFTVIVVDDASRDRRGVADAVGRRRGVRLVRGAGTGPAAARNLGSRLARSGVVCFTDDDCRPGPGWVSALVGGIEGGSDVVAGPTRIARRADVYAVASQTVTNHLVASTLDLATGCVGFAPTSNLAVRTGVLDALPFDESFPLAAGEDRDWCDRLASRGHRITWEPAAWVDHHQDLCWRRFWRQQERYGRGACRLRRARPAASWQSPAFYLGLLQAGAAGGPRVGALVVVAQVATTVGYLREATGH